MLSVWQGGECDRYKNLEQKTVKDCIYEFYSVVVWQ